jgi:hypothetical protein
MTDIVERARIFANEPIGLFRGEPEQLIDSLADEVERLRASINRMLAHCPDAECGICGKAVCPHGDPLHFHHDGCPSCWAADRAAE